MAQSRQPPARPLFGSLVLIAVVIAGGAAAFAYTAGMVLAPAPDTGQVCGCVYPAHWAAARPSPEPCQGNLLYRRVRRQWSRDGALTCSSVHPRSRPCRAFSPHARAKKLARAAECPVSSLTPSGVLAENHPKNRSFVGILRVKNA